MPIRHRNLSMDFRDVDPASHQVDKVF